MTNALETLESCLIILCHVLMDIYLHFGTLDLIKLISNLREFISGVTGV